MQRDKHEKALVPVNPQQTTIQMPTPRELRAVTKGLPRYQRDRVIDHVGDEVATGLIVQGGLATMQAIQRAVLETCLLPAATQRTALRAQHAAGQIDDELLQIGEYITHVFVQYGVAVSEVGHETVLRIVRRGGE
jgi:hypothetical protein